MMITWLLYDDHMTCVWYHMTSIIIWIQVSMLAPAINPLWSKLILMNFPCIHNKQLIDKATTKNNNNNKRQQQQQKNQNHSLSLSILTKREELSFLTVFAFPNASRIGLACSSWDSSSPWAWERPAFEERDTLGRRTIFFPPLAWWEAPATWARYWMTFLVFSVFPAPDSPLEMEGQKKRVKNFFFYYSFFIGGGGGGRGSLVISPFNL